MSVSAVTSARAETSRPQSDDYVVRSGDTLSGIADRSGVSLSALIAANPQISNPHVIRPGQTVTIPDGGGTDAPAATYTVKSGDTLSAIGDRFNVDWRIVAQQNDIANPNRIQPGDRLTIAAQAGADPAAATSPRTPSVAAVGGATRVENGTLSLTATDVLNLKKTLQTEWVQSAGDAQAHGIVDTILNRTASGHWGTSVADVVNARQQFSDINGPISRREGRDSVDDIPDSRISARVGTLVDDYLAARASGQASSIGSHLNYANPNYSSANNLGWINALDGPVLGRGDAVHHHGTTPGLERHRPGEFALALPGAATPTPAAAPTAVPTPAGGRIDGNAVAAENGVSIKSANVRIDRLDASMGPVIVAVAQAADRLGLPTPVITAGSDGRHSAKSLHYSDRALDFRGHNISIQQGRALENEVRGILGSDYDVLFETYSNNGSNNHLHVEYDPK